MAIESIKVNREALSDKSLALNCEEGRTIGGLWQVSRTDEMEDHGSQI